MHRIKKGAITFTKRQQWKTIMITTFFKVMLILQLYTYIDYVFKIKYIMYSTFIWNYTETWFIL